ncbi:MAG: replicative DNA helicase [Magnetococcales bacterium]|nr:replicative DNA helicase [Magnetococcales bacterium]
MEEYPNIDDYPDYGEEQTPTPPAFSKSRGKNKNPITRRSAWSNEAEQSILGAILLDNDVMDQVADIVSVDDFYMGAHRVIYQAMIAVLERGDPADPIILNQYLEKNEEINSVGGGGYLGQLLETVPTTANAKSYARLVRDKAILRELARQSTKISEAVFEGERTVDEIIEEAEKQIFDVGENRSQRRSNYSDMKSVIMPVISKIEELMQRKASITGVPTGFTDLDKMMAGLQPSDLIILAGRPAMGKTSFAMNVVANSAIKYGAPVAVFSLEMSKEQLVVRMLSSLGSIDAQGLRNGHLKTEAYGQLIQASDTLSKAPIFVDDTPALSIMAVRAKARRLKREKDIQLIVIDYLQLMQGEGNSDSRVQEISEISRGLKALAKELDIPVIALSQLSRKVEERPNKTPVLSDLRESGAIEQDADIVMFVFREEVYKENDPALEGMAEIIIAKQRNGPIGRVTLTFLKQYTRFDNYANNNYG